MVQGIKMRRFWRGLISEQQGYGFADGSCGVRDFDNCASCCDGTCCHLGCRKARLAEGVCVGRKQGGISRRSGWLRMAAYLAYRDKSRMTEKYIVSEGYRTLRDCPYRTFVRKAVKWSLEMEGDNRRRISEAICHVRRFGKRNRALPVDRRGCVA